MRKSGQSVSHNLFPFLLVPFAPALSQIVPKIFVPLPRNPCHGDDAD